MLILSQSKEQLYNRENFLKLSVELVHPEYAELTPQYVVQGTYNTYVNGNPVTSVERLGSFLSKEIADETLMAIFNTDDSGRYTVPDSDYDFQAEYDSFAETLQSQKDEPIVPNESVETGSIPTHKKPEHVPDLPLASPKRSKFFS